MAASVLMAFTLRRSKPVAKSQVKEHLFQQRASLQSLLQSKGPEGECVFLESSFMHIPHP